MKIDFVKLGFLICNQILFKKCYFEDLILRGPILQRQVCSQQPGTKIFCSHFVNPCRTNVAEQIDWLVSIYRKYSS